MLQFRRTLMDEIDWNDRMIGIKGTRGVGKIYLPPPVCQGALWCHTTASALYVNMNNFYFQGRGIADFAGDFVKQGGRTLLIDQVFKQPDWSKELRKCYDLYPELKIVFTGSSVMRLEGRESRTQWHREELQSPWLLIQRISSI